MTPTYDSVRAAVLEAGYRWFEPSDKPWDVNLVCLRTPETVADRFDDAVTISCHNSHGAPIFGLYKATTDPGLAALTQDQRRPEGTAILVPGQYRGSHVIRSHKGTSGYQAICHDYNADSLPVYRDANQDGIVDRRGTVYTGSKGGRGINVHRANAHRESTVVGRWSEGCMVVADPGDFAELMVIARAARDVWGNRFTLTLLDWPTPIWEAT